MILMKPPRKKIKKVGILAKQSVMRKVKNIDSVVRLLKRLGAEIYCDDKVGKKIKAKKSYSRAELLDTCDLVIVMGGDGTILKTAGQMGRKRVLILAVNYGTLGFLSESHPENLEKNIRRTFKGEYFIDKRSLLRVTHYRKNKKRDTFIALNDAVINQGRFARLIELHIDVNGTHIV